MSETFWFEIEEAFWVLIQITTILPDEETENIPEIALLTRTRFTWLFE